MEEVLLPHESEEGALTPRRLRRAALGLLASGMGLVVLLMAGTSTRMPSGAETTVAEADGRNSSAGFPFPAAFLTEGRPAEGWCERETGGTCMLFGCSEARGPTKCSQHLWCLCQPSYCSNASGVCSPASEMELKPATGPAWVRQQLHWVYFAAPFAMLGRSGFWSILGALFMRGCGGPGYEAPRTEYNRRDSFTEAMERYGYNGLTGQTKAILVALLRLLLFHLAQPLPFLLAFYAYGPLMAAWQWLLGLLVLLRELAYLAATLCGALLAPAFLLFQPLTEQDFRATLRYLGMPATFIVGDLRVKGLLGEDVAVFFLLGCLLADLCALLLLLAALGAGAMWPALALGYLLSAVSLPALILREILDG